ncbi:MAG: anhydro-N-acetylmuramic acid kinase [Gammaproteobacteria bacterium]|nr:anhydro-N-acetylmuramic acid kinase [Gammaproteobacteria bacterium]
MNSEKLYIGLMSGTSIDAIDTALVSFKDDKASVLAFYEHAIPSSVQVAISGLCQPGNNEIDRAGELDQCLGILFADAALSLMNKEGLAASAIYGIGSHGQTIRHRPNASHPFTLQIGNPSVIAYQTGITTVADFRAKDMAAGGQGAPLVPAFHQYQFYDKGFSRGILNIGGIANLSCLCDGASQNLSGFDTGPGNTLMDYWIHKHLNKAFDNNGDWARSGQLNAHLLEEFLTHGYFSRRPPKSTGREEFSPTWLESVLCKHPALPTEDVQRTLCELTARSIGDAVCRHLSSGSEVLLCGGGSKNQFLAGRLTDLLKNYSLGTTKKLGIDVDAVEAAAFAWLAHRTLASLTGSCRGVTGAQRDTVLGGIYPPG